MGNYCTRGEHDDSTTKIKFSLGKDYEEIEGQYTGEGIKKTLAWKATITRPQLEAKRQEFWQTRKTGRMNIWLVIKNAIEADHETAALILQMSGIVVKDGPITTLEDTNGNIYEIPPFIMNDPICFSDEQKKAVPKPNIVENTEIKVKIRRPGVADDQIFDINNMSTGLDVKQRYSEKEKIPLENLRLFFGGKEINYNNTLASHYIQSEMVIQVFIKANQPEEP